MEWKQMTTPELVALVKRSQNYVEASLLLAHGLRSTHILNHDDDAPDYCFDTGCDDEERRVSYAEFAEQYAGKVWVSVETLTDEEMTEDEDEIEWERFYAEQKEKAINSLEKGCYIPLFWIHADDVLDVMHRRSDKGASDVIPTGSKARGYLARRFEEIKDAFNEDGNAQEAFWGTIAEALDREEGVATE